MDYPKVTPQDIENEIAAEQYDRIPNTNITVCTLTLKNGIHVTGVNHGSVDPRNFSEEIGKEYSRKEAVEKMWPLLGFRLADKLYAERTAEPSTFLTRLAAERDRTVSDLEKLTKFLEGDTSKLPPEAVEDLRLQKNIMTQLAFILSKRYDDLTR